jgi:hypothetical protein
MYRDEYDEQPAEHECPRPLVERAAEFAVGGMFLSPAGRWETIVDRSPDWANAPQIHLKTDRTGDGYAWIFWASDKMPYVPGWMVEAQRAVVVDEYGSIIEAKVTEATGRSGYRDGHTLVSAHQVRGSGWQIMDRPTGGDLEQVEMPSKARARTEVARRAKAHAKALGIPVFRPEATR